MPEAFVGVVPFEVGGEAAVCIGSDSSAYMKTYQDCKVRSKAPSLCQPFFILSNINALLEEIQSQDSGHS